jgi:hypothetical protein
VIAVAVGLVLGGWFSLITLLVLLDDPESRPVVVGIIGATSAW